MMRFWISLLTCAVVLASPLTPAHAATTQGMSSRVQGLYFRDSEVSKVLSALARKARANIVMPEAGNAKVTATLNNVTVDDAVRIVAVQAGLAYRRIGNTFVVAKLEDMPKVLEQYGIEERVEVRNADPAAVAKGLKEAVPFLTVHPAGRTLTLVGAPEDIDKAKDLLKDLDVPSTTPVEPSVTVPIALANVKATDVGPVINKAFGKEIAQSVGDYKLVVTAPQSDLQRVQELVKSLDQGREANSRYVVYKVKYSSARSLMITLRQTFQNLTVVSGPEQYNIPRRALNLVTGNTIGVGTTGTAGTSGGTTGGFGGLGGSTTGTGTGTTDNFDQSGGGYGGFGGTGNLQQQQNGIRARTLIIGGADEVVQAALKLLDDIDVATPQVALDVKVISTNPSTLQNLGIEWSQSISSTAFERPNIAPFPQGNGNDFPSTSVTGGTPSWIRNSFSIGNWGRLPITFSATLNAFFRRQDVRILAKPTITAMDNEEGVIFVGETRRIRVSAIPGAGTGNIVVNTLVEIPVGIILQMTPRVVENDMIQLRVHPIVSSVNGTPSADGLFNSLSREAETIVRVKSGETVVIGGLLQDQDTKTLTKVPILGDIPLIGQLFRNHSTEHIRQEVVVFVTPHLVKD
jgi:general secretion pathway protein D